MIFLPGILKQSFEDKKDFTLEVPINVQNNKVYFKMKKDQIPDENNFHRNKQSIKVMVSTCLTWDEATKPFFVNGCGVKVSLQTYNDIYRRNFYLPFNLLMYIKSGFFVQYNLPSHRSDLVQDFLQEVLNSCFIKTHGCPPSPPHPSRHLLQFPQLLFLE